MKKILITGSNGLIGKSLSNRLGSDENYQLYGVSRNNSASKDNLKIDFANTWEIDELPPKIDTIIHLVQSELFRDFPENTESVFNVNTISTLKLLDYGRKAGASKFILASSGGIYGAGNDEFSEESPIGLNNDLGFYLTTKFCSELLAYNYANFFSIDILRFFFVFGHGQRQDMLIPRLVNSVKNEIPIVLQGNHGIRINPIYVEDAVDSIIKCFALRGTNRINVAGMNTLSLKEICEKIGMLVNKKPIYRFEDKEPRNIVADISKMKTLLSEPSYSFDEAIKFLI